MGSILNLVYDDIRVEKKMYETSFQYRYVKDYDIILHHIDDVNVKSGLNFYYVYFHHDYIINNIMSNCGLPFSDEVKNNLKNNPNFYFIFFNEMESDNGDCIPYLEGLLINEGYNPSQFYIVNSNQKLPQLKIKYNSKINVHVCNIGSYVVSNQLQRDLINENNLIKEHLFMFYNRNVKAHRVAALCYLKKLNILNDIDWSWLRGNEFLEKYSDLNGWFHTILNENEVIQIKEEIEYLKSVGTKKSIHENYTVDFPPHGIDWDLMYKMNPYSHSYINIVGETNYFDNDVVLISEKCFTPLYFNQIPIVLASKNHLKYLKEKFNFDLFDDIVNHSYDDEHDNRKRFLMVIDEINRLNKNKNEIIEFYKKNIDRFESNRKKVIEISKNHDESLFFKLLP